MPAYTPTPPRPCKPCRKQNVTLPASTYHALSIDALNGRRSSAALQDARQEIRELRAEVAELRKKAASAPPELVAGEGPGSSSGGRP